MESDSVKFRTFFAAASVSIAVIGCGGGGGGTGAGAGDAGAGSGVVSGGTTSGLVPAAPVVGAKLYDDASSLRPLRDGSSWTYAGTVVPYTGATPTVYRTTTTQAVAGPAGATETTDNSGNAGVDTQTVAIAGGQVAQAQSIDFAGKGSPQLFNFIELRSPVRVGDQYVSLDTRFTETAIDADSDGKADALEVAIYSRVVGAETLTLPNLPALRAVRIDTVVSSRVTYSSTGRISPAQTSSLQTWYSDGIGIVRQTTSVPTASGNGVSTTDEQLTTWDGVSAGLGALPAVPLVVPLGNSVFPGESLPGGGNLLAFAFGDRALVLSDQPGVPTTTVASQVDLRGKVLRTSVLPGLRVGAWGIAAAGAQSVVYLEPSGVGAVTQYDMTRIDPNGALIGSVRGTSIASLGGSRITAYVTRLAAAVDGDTLWLLWGRSYYDPGNGNVPGTELVLRPFGLDGMPSGPEVTVDTVDGRELALAAGGGKVSLSWVRAEPGFDVMLGSTSLGGPLQTRAFATGLASFNSFVNLLRLGTDSALLWSSPLGGGPSLDATSGVLLSPNLQPVRAGTTQIDEQIPGVPPYDSTRPGPATLGSRLVVTTTESRKLLASDASAQAVDSVNWLDTGTAPLAQTPVNSVRYASTGAKRQALFADRVLVFGGSNTLTTTVVWLNKGN